MGEPFRDVPLQFRWMSFSEEEARRWTEWMVQAGLSYGQQCVFREQKEERRGRDIWIKQGEVQHQKR